ncbi:MAG: NifU family protein [Bdellovibrionota bacterium]
MNTATKVSFEPTPNPATLKFNLPFQVEGGGFECATVQDTDASPLAAKIFGFPWTASVFVGKDFLTVTKQDWVDWNILAEPLAGLIQEHIEAGEPVVVAVTATNEDDTYDTPLVKQIKLALNKEIRPVVALDGGDVVFSRLENNILYLQMKGACAGCPSSSATLKQGIEVRLRELFPEIHEVVGV